MSEWRRLTVNDLAADKGIVGGPFGSSLGGKDYVDSGTPVIRGQNLGSDGKFKAEGFVFVTQEKTDKDLTRNIALPGDVVFTQRGTLGQVGIVPEEPFDRYVISQSQMRLRVNTKLTTSEFIYYYFRSPKMVRKIHNRAISTGVPHINLGILKSFEIDLPHLSEQRAITTVLGALDDKIAVNERISSTAIALADTLFASEATDLEFGEETFDSVARVAGGGTPKTSEEEYWGGDIAWTTPKDVTALRSPYLFNTARSITQFGLDNCASELYPAQSIFMTSRATIGAFSIPQIPAAVNQGFIVVIPITDNLRWWLFHEMRSRVDEMLSLANGSTFLELSRKNFKAMPVRIPEPDVLQRFHSRVNLLHENARNAASESRTLAALRDTLLPQLMSGKLRVKDAEKIVEDNV